MVAFSSLIAICGLLIVANAAPGAVVHNNDLRYVFN
jgi:hypothetical protein